MSFIGESKSATAVLLTSQGATTIGIVGTRVWAKYHDCMSRHCGPSLIWEMTSFAVLNFSCADAIKSPRCSFSNVRPGLNSSIVQRSHSLLKGLDLLRGTWFLILVLSEVHIRLKWCHSLADTKSASDAKGWCHFLNVGLLAKVGNLFASIPSDFDS